MRRIVLIALVAGLALAPAAHAQKAAKKPGGKPNILVIWGDDIGYWNISAYNLGQMGYKTPNIDRIAREGALFTDLYGQQSCTAGRGAFLTGQSPFRTGLLKVGLPGAKEGLQPQDPTIAELLKPQGYVTGQFGKNHLGDLDAMLPTMHGFDEFFGSLYHLNAEEEPEDPDYPKDPAFRAKYAPRGVLHTWAEPNGTQRIENTGPLTKKRMETIDEEFEAAARHVHHQRLQGRQAVLRLVQLHPHAHLDPPPAQSDGVTGLGVYPDGMVEHDAHGRPTAESARQPWHRRQHDRDVLHRQRRREVLLARRRDVALPEREGLELGRRVPRPGHDPVARHHQAGHGAERHRVARGLGADVWCRRPGNPNVKEQLLTGYQAAGKTFKVHLDGYNLTDYLSGKGADPRKDFFYFNDDGSLVGLRYNQYKVVFAEQRATGLDVWQDPFVPLRFPKLFNLRSDPFEIGDHESISYDKWRVEHVFVLVPAQAVRGQVPWHLQGLPAAPEGRQLLGR